MLSYNIGVISILNLRYLLFNMYISQSTNGDTFFNLKPSFVESHKEKFLAVSYISCASVCENIDECCGFSFDNDTKTCVLLTHCSYGTATQRGMSYFKNSISGDFCSRNNVALNKPCGQSSVSSPTNACDKANDGSLNGHIHTKETGWDGTSAYGESFPFWWVNLQTSWSVKEVVIHNRQDSYYFRLHNVNVTVGDSLTSLQQCGYHDGPVPNMDPLTITCEQDIKGRYVQIMNMDSSIKENFLHVTEVEIYDCWP